MGWGDTAPFKTASQMSGKLAGQVFPYRLKSQVLYLDMLVENTNSIKIQLQTISLIGHLPPKSQVVK